MNMKIVKRDGRVIDYDRQKIAIAIGKANDKIPEKGTRINPYDIPLNKTKTKHFYKCS